MYLNCHTYYSLRYGTLPPEHLVTMAADHGVDRLALTDINNCTAIPEFVRRCQTRGIVPVAGMEFRTHNRLLYIVLAKDTEGYRRINAFRSLHNRQGTPLPCRFPVCDRTFAVYPADRVQALAGPNGNRRWHPNERVGIRKEQLHLVRSPHLKEHPDKLVILHTVSLRDASDHSLHLHLRAIDNNVLLSHLETRHTATADHTMISPERLKARYEAFPGIIANTERLLEQCSIGFDFRSLKNKQTFTGHRAGDKALLEKLARDGMLQRYGKDNNEAKRRVCRELEIIHTLGFSAYFLITWDIVRYSRSRGYYHVGRGSGANSIVAYCLRITDVDPIELDLYFERFINPKRSTPPDFDIDYSWQERDQILEYVFSRYGHEHTALLGTMATFHHRSATREMAKVYGLPKEEADLLANEPARDSGTQDSITRRVRYWAGRINGFPNQRSIHAGGVLISEKPICYYSALDMPPKGMPTVQWDMYAAEELGFEKIDILSQRGIGHINDAVRIIKECRGKQVDIHRMDHIKNDRKVLDLLRRGETCGCFYVESPAMRGLLRKLHCDSYLRLVAASSIIRPGVSRSGMMQEYIRRTRHPETITYLHPVMEQQLRETYGIMVYQEDVIKVCHHFAGLDLADADVLRRAMSGKHRSEKEMQRLTRRFFRGCRRKGHPEKLAREVWRQIESFAGYSFSKAHSASFAVESMQSLFLKAHYPLEFMTAVINNFGGFYRSEVYFHEARRHGASIELPCINNSRYLTRTEGKTLYMGFVHIQQLERTTATAIEEHRNREGAYAGLDDFVHRTGTGIEQLIILIRTGAMRCWDIPKPRLLWHAYLVTGKTKRNTPTLFPLPARTLRLPECRPDPLADAYDEMELLGFAVSVRPFDLLKSAFRGDVTASRMSESMGRKVRMMGWLVATKYVRTVTRQTMYFGCFIDHRGDFFDTVHFPDTNKKHPFRGRGVYLLQGVITREFGHPSLIVEKMARMPVRSDPRKE